MGAVSFQLAAVFQETITEAPGGQTTGDATPVNPNQAQGAPAPQDTVTLTGQASQGQQTQQNTQQQAPFQETVLVVAEAQVQVFAQGDNGAANTGAQQTPEAPPTAQVQTQTQLQDPAAAALATGTNAQGNATGAAQGSEQELQQLDQTLQQLGIDPQSISLFNRLALLLYANDPAALQQFVQQLQQGAQEVGQGTGTTATTNQTQPQAQSPAPDQNQNAVSGQAGASSQPATSGQAAAPRSIFVQFEELQITFATAGQTQSSSTSSGNSSNSNASNPTNSGGAGGASLNVTA